MLNSIILNIENGKKILKKNISSFISSVNYAKKNIFELIIIANNINEYNMRIISKIDCDIFVSFKIISKNNYCLNYLKNKAVQESNGDFLFFCSINYVFAKDYFQDIINIRDKNKKESNNIYYTSIKIFFEDIKIYKSIYNIQYLSPLLFFNSYPISLHISGYKNIFINIPFIYKIIEYDKSYIDNWHYSIILIKKKYNLFITDKYITIFGEIYKNSLQFVKNDFLYFYYNPLKYIDICKKDYLLYKNLKLESNNIIQINNSLIYYEICDIVKNLIFDHIIIIPILTRGGSEKYILNIMKEICNQNPYCRILILSGHYYRGIAWKNNIPFNLIHVDFSIFSGYLSISNQYIIIYYLIQFIVNRNCIIHIIPSFYSHLFTKKYINFFKKYKCYFYYFSLDFDNFKNYQSSRWIDKNKEICSLIISDNKTTIKYIAKEKPYFSPSKLKCLYTVAEIIQKVYDVYKYKNSNIFWASRIDIEKRPNIVPIIGKGIKDVYPNKYIKMYGASVFNYFYFNKIVLSKDILYCGNFNSIYCLPVKPLDILIHTSYSDGLPNTILEAIGMGMVVIAPDIGGIKDIIKDKKTGRLLPSIKNDIKMSFSYVKVVLELLNDYDQRFKLAKNAQLLLRKKHSANIFSENIAKIF